MILPKEKCYLLLKIQNLRLVFGPSSKTPLARISRSCRFQSISMTLLTSFRSALHPWSIIASLIWLFSNKIQPLDWPMQLFIPLLCCNALKEILPSPLTPCQEKHSSSSLLPSSLLLSKFHITHPLQLLNAKATPAIKYGPIIEPKLSLLGNLSISLKFIRSMQSYFPFMKNMKSLNQL